MGNVQYSGSATAGIIEADTLAIVGIGPSFSNRKRYSEGGLERMGNTHVFGTAIAGNFTTPSDEEAKDKMVPLDNRLCFDIVNIVDVEEDIRKDIDDTTRVGLIAQE